MIISLKKNLSFWITIILIIAGVGGIVISYKKTLQKEKIKEETRMKGKVPVATIDNTYYDWGTISRGKKVQKEFIISNKGEGDLIISKIRTSCGCTTAELNINNKKIETPAIIPTNSKAKLTVYFDPDFMKSRGEVKRAVRIETNDPDNPFLIINLLANVE